MCTTHFDYVSTTCLEPSGIWYNIDNMYLLYVMMMKFLIHENFADDYVMIMNMIICNPLTGGYNWSQ